MEYTKSRQTDAGDPDSQLTCRQCVVQELRPENVAPCHDNTRVFVDSQWTIGSQISTVYLIYRVSVAALLVTWIVSDYVEEAGRWYSYDHGLWFIFATNWSLVFVVVVSVMMAISTSYYYVRTRRYKQELPTPISVGLSVQWIVYNIAYNSAVVVSLGYWSYVFLTDISASALSFLLTPLGQMKHSLNTVYIIVDMFANSVPIRIYHIVYPLFVGVVYSIFNAAYFLNDNRGPGGSPFAYAAMDWRDPLGSTITCLLAFLLSCLVQFFLYGLYQLRCYAHQKLQVVVIADVDGYRQVTRLNGGKPPAILADDERGPIFPNGFDAGGNSTSYHVNAGYQSIDTVEHVINGDL